MSSSKSTLKASSVEKIFRVFSRRFGYKFRPTFEDGKARELWLYDLRKAGVSDRAVNIALEQCRDLEWPPSLGEFLKRCRLRPSTVGAPDPVKAFAEATRAAHSVSAWPEDRWSHPGVMVAAQMVGAEAIRSSISARTRFEHCYEIVLRRYCAGEPMADEVLPALTKPPTPEPDFERGKRVFGELKRMLGGAR